MSELFRAFLKIATLRMGPEDLPASRFLLGLVTAVYLVSGAASVALYTTDAGEAILQLAVDLGLTVSFFGGVVVLYGKRPRLVQTMTALLGTGALLSLAALPFTAWMRLLEITGQPGAGVPALGIYFVVLWSISVTGHIVHRALGIPFLGGLIIGVAYFVLNLAAFASLFPAEA
jgi:hypothetical protein